MRDNIKEQTTPLNDEDIKGLKIQANKFEDQIEDLEAQIESLSHIQNNYSILMGMVSTLTSNQAELKKDLAMVLDYFNIEMKDIPARRIITRKE